MPHSQTLKRHNRGGPSIGTELRQTVAPDTAAALSALLRRARRLRSQQQAPPALPALPDSSDLLRVTGGQGIAEKVAAAAAAAATSALKHRVRAVKVQRFDSPLLEQAAKQQAQPAAHASSNTGSAAAESEDQDTRYIDFMALQRALTELAQADPAMARALLSLIPSSLRHAAPKTTKGPVAESGGIGAFRSAMSFAKHDAATLDDNDFDSAPAASAYSISGAAHDPAAAAAAAGAVADVLLRRLGSLVDGNAAEERNVEADWALIELAASQGALSGDVDGSNGVEVEQLLHKQIYGALWNAISAMERWSTAVARWQVKAVRETNAWLEANQELILARSGGRVGSAYLAVPAPAMIDMTADAADADAHARMCKDEVDVDTTAALAAAEWRGQRAPADIDASHKARPQLMAAANDAERVLGEDSGMWSGVVNGDEARSLGAISFHGLHAKSRGRNSDRASVSGIDFRFSPSGIASSRGSSSGVGSNRFDPQDSIGSSSTRSAGNALASEDSQSAAPAQQRQFSRMGSSAGAVSGQRSPAPEPHTSTSPAAAGIRALFSAIAKEQRSVAGSPTASMSDGELSPERSGGSYPVPGVGRAHRGRIAPLPAMPAAAQVSPRHEAAGPAQDQDGTAGTQRME